MLCALLLHGRESDGNGRALALALAVDIDRAAVHTDYLVRNCETYARTAACVVSLVEFCLYLRKVGLLYAAARIGYGNDNAVSLFVSLYGDRIPV